MLHAKQEKAVALLAEGQSRDEVAEAVGVSPATVSRWRSITEFDLALAKAQGDDLDPMTVLKSCVRAVDPRGNADYRTRMQAALALLKLQPKEGGRGEWIHYDDDNPPPTRECTLEELYYPQSVPESARVAEALRLQKKGT